MQMPYFVNIKHSDFAKKFSEADIIKMLEFLIDNIFVLFGRCAFRQPVGTHMGKNCNPFLTDLFLYSYEADFIQGVLNKNERS